MNCVFTDLRVRETLACEPAVGGDASIDIDEHTCSHGDG